jgi:hypothetical protein
LVARAPRGAFTRRSITSDRVVRLAGLYAVVAGAASFVIAPLLALSFFATEDGEEELEVGSVSAWAEPARDVADGFLTFASADSVYFTYLKSLMLVAPALFVCAWAVRSRRPERRSHTEVWGWRTALTGYGLLALGVIVAPPGAVLNVVFFALIVPGLLLGTIGSTVLGIALLRASYRPRLTPWLLALSVPLWLIGSVVLGHNSLGLLPLFVAWGASGWRLWRP